VWNEPLSNDKISQHLADGGPSVFTTEQATRRPLGIILIWWWCCGA